MDTCVRNENDIVGKVRNREVTNSANELYHNSESSWIETKKNIPWWRTADREELVSLVSQRSEEFIENCDLPSPRPQNNNIGSKRPDDVNGYVCARDLFSKRRLASAAENNQMSDILSPEKVQVLDSDPSNMELLKALQHSQTRAREAEKVAKQAYAEKEHVVKLVFRQASQIFAYKQCLQLLHLENMYFQVKDNVNRSASSIMPVMLPLIPQKTRKMQKSCQNPPGRKRAKRACSHYNVGKLAIVFALGLSLISTGLLLGWTIGWMLW